jgi:hypothetical protein
MKTMKTIITIIIATIFTANVNAQSKFTVNSSIETAANNVKLTGENGTELKYVLGANGPSIKWETSNEANTSHFELQISDDGKEFSTIRKVAASDVTEWNTAYETKFSKNYISVKKVYYRLKIVFSNGSEILTAATSFKIPGAKATSYASIH